VYPSVALFQLIALVDEQGHVAAVIDHQFRPLAAFVAQRRQRAIPYSSAIRPSREDRTPVAAIAAAA